MDRIRIKRSISLRSLCCTSRISVVRLDRLQSPHLELHFSNKTVRFTGAWALKFTLKMLMGLPERDMWASCGVRHPGERPVRTLRETSCYRKRLGTLTQKWSIQGFSTHLCFSRLCVSLVHVLYIRYGSANVAKNLASIAEQMLGSHIDVGVTDPLPRYSHYSTAEQMVGKQYPCSIHHTYSAENFPQLTDSTGPPPEGPNHELGPVVTVCTPHSTCSGAKSPGKASNLHKTHFFGVFSFTVLVLDLLL